MPFVRVCGNIKQGGSYGYTDQTLADVFHSSPYSTHSDFAHHIVCFSHSTLPSTNNMSTNECGCVPIILDLQIKVVGWNWPAVHSLPTLDTDTI